MYDGPCCICDVYGRSSQPEIVADCQINGAGGSWGFLCLGHLNQGIVGTLKVPLACECGKPAKRIRQGVPHCGHK